ncbi:A kinase (PRKA) anchor protein 1b [Trichomycterus rosablanca]|uniref:A kinase (PRKA) anchor protein 1b n=1 Tax=Trichomycterus rosablanca TaxID=2290929 RepID=UPI002F353D65
MPLKARNFLPYTLPGVLALIGLWWYTSRKKEQTVTNDGGGRQATSLLSSPEVSAEEVIEATHGITHQEGHYTKELSPAEQEVVAQINSLLTNSAIEETLGIPLIDLESGKLSTSSRDTAGAVCQQSDPELISEQPDIVLAPRELVEKASSHKSLQTAALSNESGVESLGQTLDQQETDTREIKSVVDSSLESAKAETLDLEVDKELTICVAESIEADSARDSLFTTKEQLTSSTPTEHFSYAQTLSEQSLCHENPVLPVSLQNSTSSPLSNDSIEGQYQQNGDLKHTTDSHNSMEELHSLAASLISEVLSSAAREVTAVSTCESQHRKVPEQPDSIEPALNGTGTTRDDHEHASRVESSTQSHSDHSLKHIVHISEVNGCLTPTEWDISGKQEDFVFADCQGHLESTPILPRVQAQAEVVAGTEDSVCSTFQSESSVTSEDFLSTGLSLTAVSGSKDHSFDINQHGQLDTTFSQSEVSAQEVVTADLGCVTHQSENGICTRNLSGTGLAAAGSNEETCISPKNHQGQLPSTPSLPEVQAQVDIVTKTEDSGLYTCQLESGICTEDLPNTSLSSAVPFRKEKQDPFDLVKSSQSEVETQNEFVSGTEDSGCVTFHFEDIGSKGLHNTLLSDTSDDKPESDEFTLDNKQQRLESMQVLTRVQAQEEVVTGTEDSGCSTCQSEDGNSSEDLLGAGSSSAVTGIKDVEACTTGILTLEKRDNGVQENLVSAELEEPALSLKHASANCASAQLNGEDLKNGTSEAEADQSGSDVNSMDSMDSITLAGGDSQDSGSQGTNLIVWEIEVPRHLVGRLIGKKGRYVSFLKQTSGAKIYISTLPYTQEFQICHIEGTQQQVDRALALIGKKFKDLELTNVYTPSLQPTTMPSLSITSWLLLPNGVAVEVIVVNIVSAGHIFVQQHTHPTYHALRSLDQQMFLCYSQPGTPALPSPAEVGVICAAPVMDGAWWRAQVISFYKDSHEVEIRYVDYGGYERVKIDTLRQIRSDFVTLPFQGTEVLLDNVAPLAGEEQFSSDANSALDEITRGVPLLAQVTNYDNNTGLPLVQMWSMVGEELVLLNRTLTDRGLATWVDSF